jgi:A/G-specific adenine glycosylase
MADSPWTKPGIKKTRIALLEWFDKNCRDLPWRGICDPYAIWVSEIMLQQTRVAAVLVHYKAFLMQFPTVIALAVAPEQQVLAAWSGLGYYRRARMLHKAAQFLVSEHGGQLPHRSAALRKLPGIGDYTSAAIASIAFGEPCAVVDGNVERVVMRLAGLSLVNSAQKGAIRRRVSELAQILLDIKQPGNWNQAMMELGATKCIPLFPSCTDCPLYKLCKTRGEHAVLAAPAMISRQVAFALVERGFGRSRDILLQQRPENETVMPGLWELPQLSDPEVPESELRITVRHSIMQTNYYVRIRTLAEEEFASTAMHDWKQQWVRSRDLASTALTGLARKVLMREGILTKPRPSLDPEEFREDT